MIRVFPAAPSRPPTPPGRCRGGTLIGLMAGFVMGLVVAAGIAYFLLRMPNPFDKQGPKSDIVTPHVSSVEREQKPAPPAGERPKFDFSKILPGTEDRRVAKDDAPAVVPRGADRTVSVVTASEGAADKASGKYFLQAGAYQNAADAEDQRAKLALMGIEASLQSVDVPDKGTVNRIRLGPYSSVDEMNQVKADLLKRGVSTAVIKNP
jgi:cell division protein FtsN